MLKYKLYKDTRSNSQFKGCWYARIAKSDIITTRQLVAHMAKHGTAYSVTIRNKPPFPFR